MGTLNIYKGLSEEYRTIKGNASVNELAHALCPELNLKQCIILNAGEQIAPDYILKENDIVFIRVIPGAAGTIMAVIALVCAAVSVGAAVYSAIEQQKAQEEMEKAQRQSKALAERITQLPFLKGANNRTALGYNIPYIMGSVYDVPYKLVAGYYTIAGENGASQFWNVVLVAGFNNALIQDVSIGTKVIKHSNQEIEVPGQTEEIPYLGDAGPFAYSFDEGDYYDPADELDIKYEDEIVIDGLNEKVSCTSFSDELDYNNAVVKQAATNTYKFDVCILFNGLRRYDDGWKSKNVSVKVEWSNDGSTWNDAGNIVTGDINSRKQVRFSKTVTLTAAQCVGKDIQIRLTRLTALEESNSQETCYLCYLNCWQYDAAKSTSSAIVTCPPLEQPWRGRTTRLALRIISNESTKDNLDQININAYGKARIWNDDAWTVDKYPTRNPASWVLEIMTTDIHPHSQYIDEEIDLEALGAVYTYCQQNGFYCDGILTEDSKKADVLNSILSECNTTMYRDDATGKWTFAIERAQSTPVALLNEQCIRSVTVTKTFERKPYAVKTTFTNRESWAVDTFYQTVNGKVDSSAVYGEHKIIVENAPKYITTFEHAYKYTHRILAKQQLQPREITVQVGRDGDYYPLYSKVMLQMKQLRIGLSNGIIHGSVVEGGLLTQIITSDFCDFTDSNARYGLIIQAQNDSAKEHLYIEVEPADPTKRITRNVKLSIPLAINVIPEYGNIYSFGYLNESGEFSRVTNEMMIYNRKQNSDGWELLLKDYNSAIFQFGDIPEYQTNLTTPKESGNMLPEAIMQKMADIADEVSIPGPQGPQGDIGPQGPQGEPGESVYDVHFDVESFCFTCDNTGKAWGEKVAATIHLTYGEEELPFTIVSIGNDGSQIAATIKGKTIYFESLKGVKIDEGGNIPVVIRYRATTGTAIGFNTSAIGFSNKPIGYLNYAGENKDFTVYFNYSTVRAGANKGLLTEINDYLSAGGTRYKGDYFTWGGDTTSVTYSGVTYTFLKGRVYSWNGYQWAESTNDGEISDSFNNVMSVLDDEIVNNDSKLEQTMRKLSSVTVFCEELAAKVAFIQKLFAQNITMQQGGLFKSANWNGTFNQDTHKIQTYGDAGWALDYNGTADFVDINATGGNFNKVSVSGFVGANGLDFILETGNIEQFFIYQKAVGGIGVNYGQYIVIPFKGKIKYRMEMFDGSVSGSGDTVYNFYLNGNVYKSFAFPKSGESHIFEEEIDLNFGDELKCKMEGFGGRVSNASFYVRFYANSENYFLNMINKSQIKDL